MLALLALAGCGDDSGTVQGYVEGDFLRIGLPAGGRVVSVAVERGTAVQAGDPLFSLDDQAERAAVAEAKAKLDQTLHQRDNLLTGRRALEIRAIEAQKAQAEADLRLASVQLRRQEELARTDATSRANLDNARAAMERARGRVAELTAQLGFAREGARSAEIEAADAAVEAARAAVQQADWRLGERTAAAPKAGLVDDVLFRPGEEVAAGQPVVSLLPPDNVKLRFYLGPDQVGRITGGTPVTVACAGCPPELSAKVSFIAREASFAPPIIYSRDHAAKLVFLVEARPDRPSDRLRPGQPVTVTLPGAAR
ncbi:MAG: HlyD family secretion protein [Actinomycetota bacterium]